MEKKIYLLKGIDCANCAAAIERRLQKERDLQDVSVTFATEQLRYSTEDPQAAFEKVKKIVGEMEPEVELIDVTRGGQHKHDHHHDHHHEEDHCHCHSEHDHHHEEDHSHCHHEHDHHHEEDHSHCHHEHDHHHGEDHSHCHSEHDHHHGEDHCHCHSEHDEELVMPHASRSHTHFERTGEHHKEGHEEGCQCVECIDYIEICDICGKSLAECKCHMPDEDLEKRVYIMEGIDCAACAAKVEAKIQSLPEVAYANATFATKELRVSADHQEDLLPVLQAAVDSVEDGVTLVPKTRKRKKEIADTKLYILEGLDCANCAKKVEDAISKVPGVDAVTVTYETLQMKLSAKDPDAILPQVKEAIDAVEDGITIVPKETAKKEAREKEEERESIFENDLAKIGIGAVLFVVGEVLEHTLVTNNLYLLPIYLIAYLILGGEVLKTAFSNLKKGQWFDENFLMVVATLGAFCIKQFPEAVGVMLFYEIGEYFQDRASEQSRSQIMDAVDMRPETVNLLVGDDTQVIDAEEANVGDIIMIRPGDRIPLDGIIIEGNSRIDTSPVTGEPVPVSAGVGDQVVSGCVNTSGQITMRVEKVLEESMVTRILDSVENAAASKPAIDKFITRFCRYYTPFVVFFAIFVALIVPFIFRAFGMNWHYIVTPGYTGIDSVFRGASGTPSIYTALTFLVISCPCALVLSVPLAFFAGIGSASKKGILFKGGIAIEALNKVRAIVMDKTGTITQGNFLVQKVVTADDKVTADKLLSLAASAELASTHPIAESIVEAAEQKKLEIERPSKVEEIAGHGIRAVVSEGTILCGNRKLLAEDGVNLDNFDSTDFGTEVLVSMDGHFLGNIVISDTIKEDAKEAITNVKSQGVITVMLTGDAEDNANAVARETGVDEVYAKLLPQEKLSKLQEIRQKHGTVMFVGDGINDAPVLANADVGAAMGSGADAAIEAADVVFMNSNMEAIPQAIRISKITTTISWENVVLALGVKATVLLMGVFGFANMWLAVFADTGVSVICLLNSMRILRK
ncbi:MAG: heavy metal translocating P-type ATPase [Lachnospiraceae bacterium]|nr:heavy metal translocating P-type ATPase [Lachnospiraceae bacterium]